MNPLLTRALFDDFMMSLWTDKQFEEAFRMTRTTFDQLCAMLSPVLDPHPTNWRDDNLSTRHKVALSLYKLGSDNISWRTVGDVFGVARSTACKACYQFIGAVLQASGTKWVLHTWVSLNDHVIMMTFGPPLQVMKDTYVQRPTGPRAAVIKNGFAKKGFPNCLGALDCSEIHIRQPARVHPHGYEDYYNMRKGGYTMKLQGVCAHDMVFWDVCVGAPGDGAGWKQM